LEHPVLYLKKNLRSYLVIDEFVLLPAPVMFPPAVAFVMLVELALLEVVGELVELDVLELGVLPPDWYCCALTALPTIAVMDTIAPSTAIMGKIASRFIIFHYEMCTMA
jgi:hypothetical protein